MKDNVKNTPLELIIGTTTRLGRVDPNNVTIATHLYHVEIQEELASHGERESSEPAALSYPSWGASE